MTVENYEEIGDVLFSHPIGSDLCGTRIASSDFDRLVITKELLSDCSRDYDKLMTRLCYFW